MRTSRATYLAWVRDEVLLVALLGAALAFFLARPELRDPYDLPSLRLFLDTCVVLVAVIVSVLAFVRFSLERRRFDLFLLGGFFLTAAGTLAFAVAPSLDGGPIGRVELWAGITARLAAALMIAAAPFAPGIATPVRGPGRRRRPPARARRALDGLPQRRVVAAVALAGARASRSC